MMSFSASPLTGIIRITFRSALPTEDPRIYFKHQNLNSKSQNVVHSLKNVFWPSCAFKSTSWLIWKGRIVKTAAHLTAASNAVWVHWESWSPLSEDDTKSIRKFKGNSGSHVELWRSGNPWQCDFYFSLCIKSRCQEPSPPQLYLIHPELLRLVSSSKVLLGSRCLTWKKRGKNKRTWTHVKIIRKPFV